jgi:DNA-binding NarL/FixJ family response regulator
MTEPARQHGAIRVLVVDDHDLFRAGLASLLAAEPDIEVVAQASGGRRGVRLADELRPDVVLMDLRMPDLEGDEATREILERIPTARVLVLTVASDDSDVEAALAAGACGFIAKDTPVERVAVAVRAAAQGVAWLSPRAAEVVLGRVRQRGIEQESEFGLSEQLSARELDVLRLIARGMENAEIAGTLGISPRTAKNHVSNILGKLGLPSRVQAAIYAVRRGLD